MSEQPEPDRGTDEEQSGTERDSKEKDHEQSNTRQESTEMRQEYEEEEHEATGPDSTAADEEQETSGRLSAIGGNVRRYLLWGAFALSLVFVAIAAFNLYFQVGHIINLWIESPYRPMFQAAFNLVVLLVAGYVSALIANRLEVID
ncbi:MAG: hypothetical protein ABEJ58_01835 [Halodesulfurarchaeum sp.]